jgi:hypothetical protein
MQLATLLRAHGSWCAPSLQIVWVAVLCCAESAIKSCAMLLLRTDSQSNLTLSIAKNVNPLFKSRLLFQLIESKFLVLSQVLARRICHPKCRSTFGLMRSISCRKTYPSLMQSKTRTAGEINLIVSAKEASMLLRSIRDYDGANCRAPCRTT